MSADAADSGSYLWTFPECPLRIRLGFSLIERLRAEILRPDSAENEVGGLLIGEQSSLSGDIEILDFFPMVDPNSVPVKEFVISPASLARAAALCTPQRVIGYYRSHLGPRVYLRPQDLDCIHKCFRDPANVFLVIRPHDGRVSAGFFFWQDGSVFADWCMTFPLSATSLKSRTSAAAQVGGTAKESAWRHLYARAQGRVGAISARAKYGLLLGAIAVLPVAPIVIKRDAIVGALRSRHSTADVARPLGLRVQRDGFNLVIAWDRSAPEIASAKEGGLVISDGTNQPLLVPLTADDLRTGSVSYTSVSDPVDFRLSVTGASGAARTESIISSSRRTP